jgi:hypothetical protein
MARKVVRKDESIKPWRRPTEYGIADDAARSTVLNELDCCNRAAPASRKYCLLEVINHARVMGVGDTEIERLMPSSLLLLFRTITRLSENPA